MIQKIKLESIAEIVMGQSPKGDTCSINESGTPLLNGPTEFGSRHPFAVQYTSAPKKFSQKNDILFCVRGSTTGRMNYSDKKYAIGRGLAAIRGINGYHTPYIRAILEYYLEKILKSATGSTFPNVGKDLLNNLEVPKLDQEYANKVSSIINCIEAKIYTNISINNELDKLASSIFKSWFVDFDPVMAQKIVLDKGGSSIDAKKASIAFMAGLCTLDDIIENERVVIEKVSELTLARQEELEKIATLFPADFKDSDLGLIPLNFQAVPVKDLSELITKGTTPRKGDIDQADKNKETYFIKVRDITDNHDIINNNLEKVPYDIHSTKLKRSILKKDDILCSIAGTIGRVAILPAKLNDSNCNQAVAFVRLKETEQYLHIVFETLRLKRTIDFFNASVTQGVQANISLKNVGDVLVGMPPMVLLEEYNKRTKDIYTSIQCNRDEIAALHNLRDTLLPKLLNGEIDLSNVDIGDYL